VHLDRLELDGNPSLALQIHLIEELLFHLALFHRTRQLEQPIGKSRFAVIDMGDDAKIADVSLVHTISTNPLFPDDPRQGLPSLADGEADTR
jgi:hypothetical protein